MKKKLNVAGIVNELTGQSAFFRKAEQDDEKGKKVIRRSNRATIRRTDEATISRSDEPTKRRNDATQTIPKTRMAFDLPGDMSKAIRKEKAMREIQEGRAASLSEIAIEAFSLYFREASKRRND